MKTYTLKKQFKNYYVDDEDTITFQYDVFDGFDSLLEARNVVNKLNQDPDHFLYITFQRQIYAVSMETQKRQIVIGKNEVYLRMNQESIGLSLLEKTSLPFTITKPRIRCSWKNELRKDLERIEGSSIKTTGDQQLLNEGFVHHAISLLGIAFYGTIIPVFQLNCVDSYFNHPPAQKDLWAEGIYAVNPFKNEFLYVDSPIYTLDMYYKERRKTSEQSKHLSA